MLSAKTMKKATFIALCMSLIATWLAYCSRPEAYVLLTMPTAATLCLAYTWRVRRRALIFAVGQHSL